MIVFEATNEKYRGCNSCYKNEAVFLIRIGKNIPNVIMLCPDCLRELRVGINQITITNEYIKKKEDDEE